MSTTSFAPIGTGCPTCSIMPQQKPTRQIIREEIRREAALQKLEAQYKNGEISELQYKIQKAIIMAPDLFSIEPTMERSNIGQPRFSTTA